MRFVKWLEETTTTAAVAQPLAKGKVDVVGAKKKCPDGHVWDAKQLECVPDIKIKEGKDPKIWGTGPTDDWAKGIVQQFGKDKGSLKGLIDWYAKQGKAGKPYADVLKKHLKESKEACADGHEYNKDEDECIPVKDKVVKEGKLAKALGISKCPENHDWDEEQQQCVPKIRTQIHKVITMQAPILTSPIHSLSKIKEALLFEKVSMKDVPARYLKDPLYKKVLMAKSKNEYEKALDTLTNIRGESAVENFKKKIKGK